MSPIRRTLAAMAVALRFQNLGPYQMGERLGVGGMAEVFSAESKVHGKIALKRILPGLAQDTEFADMFWDEARMTSQLDHPNIIKILDYGCIDSELFMALEYVAGPTLARVVRRAAREKAPFNPAALVAMVVELLDALHYVHTASDSRGICLDIVHRDISPGNVMLTAEGHVKLGDFGILRSQAVVRRTLPGELKGKMGYMSPEQARGDVVTCQSDVFSVGIIMAEFLTLRPLFLGKNEMDTLTRTANVDLETWRRHCQHVPLSLRAIVEKALRRDVSERYQSATEMRTALVDVAEVNRWELNSSAVLSQLRKLELFPGEKHTSGERRIVTPRRELASRPPEAVTLVDIQSVLQSPGTPVQPQGRPEWTVSFSRSSLPMRLFLAFRRIQGGVVQLNSEDGQRSLNIELRGGSIFAAHDSEAYRPLGRLLQDSSLLSPGDLAHAIGESRRANLRLGQYLVLHGRLRESTLQRLLSEQTELRLGRWFREAKGKVAVYPSGPSIANHQSDVESLSLGALVAAMRQAIVGDVLVEQLTILGDAIVVPAMGAKTATFALTEPERRVLQTTLEGGAYEGMTVKTILRNIENERIARRSEAMFALLVGLSAGLIQAPGFGR